MPSPSVGGIACTFVHRAELRGVKERVEIWEEAGVDGIGGQLMGRGDSGFRFRAVVGGTATAVDTWFANIEALQGQIIQIVDDWGKARASMFVRWVGKQLKQAVVNSTLGACRGEIEIAGVILP